jgi:hypothetical protein
MKWKALERTVINLYSVVVLVRRATGLIVVDCMVRFALSFTGHVVAVNILAIL